MNPPENLRDQDPTAEQLIDRHSDIETLLAEENEHREQQVGGKALDELDLDEDITEIPSEHILETTGLLSHVRDGDGEDIGHIYMTEYDGCDNPMIPISHAIKKPGISVLFRSSPGNYHVYNLSVRSFNEQLRDMAAGSGDLGHVRWTSRRGYAVLRIIEKRFIESGEVYKPAPKLLGVWSSESDYSQSFKHWEFFRSVAVDQGDSESIEALDAAKENHELIGESLVTEHYQTITDQAKEARR